jgi:hypothetical protein
VNVAKNLKDTGLKVGGTGRFDAILAREADLT